MGWPIGSINRERPVRDLLRLAVLTGGSRRLCVIVEKMLERAEGGDLQAIRGFSTDWTGARRRRSNTETSRWK
jgi:hypothetical protein